MHHSPQVRVQCTSKRLQAFLPMSFSDVELQNISFWLFRDAVFYRFQGRLLI